MMASLYRWKEYVYKRNQGRIGNSYKSKAATRSRKRDKSVLSVYLAEHTWAEQHCHILDEASVLEKAKDVDILHIPITKSNIISNHLYHECH